MGTREDIILTAAQIYVLRKLLQGEHIAYSQDGDTAWFFPAREFLKISDEELDALRRAKLIGDDPAYDWEEAYRFVPCDVITDAGRARIAALETEEGKNGGS